MRGVVLRIEAQHTMLQHFAEAEGFEVVGRAGCAPVTVFMGKA